MMKEVFAKSLDYLSYETLKTDSILILQRNDIYYYIVKSRNDFIVWGDFPVYCRIVKIFKSYKEARDYILGTPKHQNKFFDLFCHLIGLNQVMRT
ncbi:MAG: hypothetical protein APF81_11920 [Desulfosporosinus sp. BRH_c37]|nr:MAG: hypothetical protein APF81_11920 [Desulfosporosinus sp. BRH_c37]